MAYRTAKLAMIAALTVGGILVCQPIFAATLIVDLSVGVPGERGILISIAVETWLEEEPSTIQFDMAFDARVLALSEVVAGEAAQAAGKMLSANEFGPGVVRVVVAGLNQTAISTGPIAEAYFAISPDAPAGLQAISLGYAVASDPYGAPLEVEAVRGGIEVVRIEGSPEGEKDSQADTESLRSLESGATSEALVYTDGGTTGDGAAATGSDEPVAGNTLADYAAAIASGRLGPSNGTAPDSGDSGVSAGDSGHVLSEHSAAVLDSWRYRAYHGGSRPNPGPEPSTSGPSRDPLPIASAPEARVEKESMSPGSGRPSGTRLDRAKPEGIAQSSRLELALAMPGRTVRGAPTADAGHPVDGALAGQEAWLKLNRPQWMWTAAGALSGLVIVGLMLGLRAWVFRKASR